MKKRLLTLALAICVLAPVTLSARAFDFNLGATAQYQKDISGASEAFEASDLIDINNYSFGAETRFNFLLLEVANTTLFGATEVNGKSAVEFSNHVAAGIYSDVANVVRLGLLAGPEFTLKISEDGLFSADNSEFKFLDIFMKSNFNYKAHVDFLLGDTLTLSATYTLPTTFNLDTLEFTDLIPSGDDFSEGRVGISLLLF